eukprot:Unigene14909_Nuclearia_a/m.44768 Unigene14909_Nuclearia_a/g.44768  ORF Unigene14909_Nuclearia_a/g.44768 Unigene14909_Nuclearia_a/m.44768 type:complete len:146 (-) Unigene14909_Nuclearia_a:60-497(-)
MSSCRSSTGGASKLQQQIHKKIRTLETTLLQPYDGRVTHSCLVSATGSLIAQKRTPETDEVALTVHGLHQSAVQLAESLGDGDVPMLHVRGAQHLFLCFRVGQHLLALFVTMPPDKIDQFDGFALGDQLQHLIEELRLLVETNAV